MSSHVLDTASGSPASGVRISLELLGEEEEGWTLQDTRSVQLGLILLAFFIYDLVTSG